MEKILPWFALKSVPGIGNHLIKRLISRFNSPESVFAASRMELVQIEGVSPRLASAILQHKIPATCKRDLDDTLKRGYKIVPLSDPAYPPLLLEIPDPPPFLYVFGNLDPAAINIAVVGSRNATDYGISTTRRLCTDLAGLGITVVSGMAKGIDTAAHEGALTGKGKTIAILGSGLDRIYPRENKRLFYQIAENGAVISEFPLLTDPEPHNFPVRNRVISGMSLGTVVVEASRKSGSLITARLAGEQGREVFAIPGSIRSFKSTGTHQLIKQGAKLVEHTRDILEELSHVIQPVSAENKGGQNAKGADPDDFLSPEELKVIKALGPYPVHIDTLAQKTGMLAGKLSGILLQLELKGLVHQSPGKFFILT
ncbi:MAG: DNA-processing protein DprA [Desulfobacterales bacterium]|nr:DNA-processing protein DprA [Desulfobacterales bacterium]